MLRYLQRAKARKGFTIIELIVVIAIIAVLMAVVLPMIGSERGRIQEARSTATDFYAAVQTIMTKYSFYDGYLGPKFSIRDSSNKLDEDKQPGIMRYYSKMGGNYPYDKNGKDTAHEYPENTSMYIMVHAKNNIIQTVGIVSKAKSNTAENSGFFKLLHRDSADRSTEFGKLFAAELDGRIVFRDGYYYARVDFIPPTNADGTINKDEINAQTVKVAYTAYLRKELPKSDGTTPVQYENDYLRFDGDDYKLKWNNEICGTCAPFQNSSGLYVGLSGTKLD